jgi:hypothetical protein
MTWGLSMSETVGNEGSTISLTHLSLLYILSSRPNSTKEIKETLHGKYDHIVFCTKEEQGR